MTEEPLKNREIIFEVYAIGPYAKIVAMDVATMTEASIQGPKTTPQPILQREAMKKLAYVMRKKGLID
ncbi:MAG: hypothetical protein DI551_08455 [Micavibrio aeruginosavorus]|uniref:DUF6898 domain-containing protein n=1 Tax=Micavibrio aeruginosavorus TaxID=349221 RepID=A0A2W5PKI7_9BACT|nr:MAG: hypothetical protein DI551_08455 [Micavibrio aeruginosavorus]